MGSTFPSYLEVPDNQLGQGTAVRVQRSGQMSEIAEHMARAMLKTMEDNAATSRPATLIIPVGPVDQFPVLANLINHQRFDCREVMLINMDEYLAEGDRWVDIDHPLSFRGYMNRKFYDLIDPQLAPAIENRVFPDPREPAAIQQLIEQRGGVDACFGGIGINGHMAFNEPPEPGSEMSIERFAELPTRILDLSRETRTINSVTVGGEMAAIPRRAITVGMKEILASKQLRFYCNRPWQSSVVRRVLHGPITSACPASLMRTHADAVLTVADYVAARPDIRLR